MSVCPLVYHHVCKCLRVCISVHLFVTRICVHLIATVCVRVCDLCLHVFVDVYVFLFVCVCVRADVCQSDLNNPKVCICTVT